MKTRAYAMLLVVAVLAGCSSENTYERKADDITRAVMNNDLRPIMSEISPGARVTRVQVAAWSDELGDQGKLQSIVQTTDNCESGEYCFVATFEKNRYSEEMKLDDRDQIVAWRFHRISGS